MSLLFSWPSAKPMHISPTTTSSGERTLLASRNQLCTNFAEPCNTLIYNMFLEDIVTCGVENRKKWNATSHELMVAPRHAQKFKFGKWQCEAKQPYQQYTCSAHGCIKRVWFIVYAPQVLGCVSHVTITTLCGAWQAKKVAAELSIAIFSFSWLF